MTEDSFNETCAFSLNALERVKLAIFDDFGIRINYYNNFISIKFDGNQAATSNKFDKYIIRELKFMVNTTIYIYTDDLSTLFIDEDDLSKLIKMTPANVIYRIVDIGEEYDKEALMSLQGTL